jgi:hypothetical protein
MRKKYKTAEKIFFLLVLLDVLFILLVPFLNINIVRLSDESSEFIFITTLFFLMTIIYRFYAKELKKNKIYQEGLEERLRETFKYIGSVNLQIEEMKKVFSDVKYPENKKDLHALFINMSERILGIVSADWVLLRIVDINNWSTLHEHFIVRGNKNVERIKFDNKSLSKKVSSDSSQTIIKSTLENFNIKAFCILPITITKDQEFMIKSIINQLEMMFIVFNSLYYKKKNK